MNISQIRVSLASIGITVTQRKSDNMCILRYEAPNFKKRVIGAYHPKSMHVLVKDPNFKRNGGYLRLAYVENFNQLKMWVNECIHIATGAYYKKR